MGALGTIKAFDKNNNDITSNIIFNDASLERKQNGISCLVYLYVYDNAGSHVRKTISLWFNEIKGDLESYLSADDEIISENPPMYGHKRNTVNTLNKSENKLILTK